MTNHAFLVDVADPPDGVAHGASPVLLALRRAHHVRGAKGAAGLAMAFAVCAGSLASAVSTRATTLGGASGTTVGLGPPGTSFSRAMPAPPPGGWTKASVDVQVTRAPLTDPNTAYYYAEQWTMETPGSGDGTSGAYMGIQTRALRPDGTEGPLAIVTLWTKEALNFLPGTGTDEEAASCYLDPNGAEGSVATCHIVFDWQQGHVYRYGFARTADHQWTATITDMSAAGTPVTTLGTFIVPATWLGIHAWDIGFQEQFIWPPETQRAFHPVCPSHRSTVRFLHARVDDTVAPISETPWVYLVNTYDWITCQNATATLVPDGVQLDTDIPNPAPVTALRATRKGSTVTLTWTPPRDPATVTKSEFAASKVSPALQAALKAIAVPIPTRYIVTVSPGGRRLTIPASKHRATITGLAPVRRYTFTIRAYNGAAASAAISTSLVIR